MESTQSSKIGRIHTIESQLYYRSPPRYPMTVDTYRGRGTLGFDRRDKTRLRLTITRQLFLLPRLKMDLPFLSHNPMVSET